MTKKALNQDARAYMDKALATQRRLGFSKSVPADVYRRATNVAAQALRDLASASEGLSDHGASS
jgi:hypothetical protein